MKYIVAAVLFCCTVLFSAAQQSRTSNPVYVDKQGVLRWSGTNKEAAFFGVNYTVPFAYGYRSHKALGVVLEKAIDQDVYHFARLGLNAFRVHVWDTEITDSLGSLKENEHLRLFDYLLYKLKERGIKILITPLAYWGNGYPERDENTGSFSSKYNKQQVLVTEAAIKAQENYLQQFFRHVNPYTKTTYGNDPDVIAMEINNEPHHSGPKEKVTEFVNRMVAAVKSTGWTKPIFYNISESPAYADAVAKANVDGHSFQWYPTGLVANRTLQGNYLPHVDRYRIPFTDTIPSFRNRARMVYEFDAGDVLQPVMYPAMARSFRTAGMQWATQFAYDPLATAYGNTEYQTHYVNLAYTPSKAISLLLAAQVFQQVPRGKSYGTYPADSIFESFRVSYKEALSEMNTAQEFYYANNTSTHPVNPSALQRIAGVGSSPVVRYSGTGAYFLDKLEEGVWRLEVMPDAVFIRDPFAKASPRKEVTRIQWAEQKMTVQLPDLQAGFRISGINEGTMYASTAAEHEFAVWPGVYLLVRKGKEGHRWTADKKLGVLQIGEFAAPQPRSSDPFVVHQPFAEVVAGKPFTLHTRIAGVDTADKISLELRHSANQWKTLPLQPVAAYAYKADVPADVVQPGLLQYRIIIQRPTDSFFVFPGGHKEDPYAWDAYAYESWQTFVVPEPSPLRLFDALNDRSAISVYNPGWRNHSLTFTTTGRPGQLALKATMQQHGQMMGFQFYFKDKIKGREEQLSAFKKLVVRARMAGSEAVQTKLLLLTANGAAYSAPVLVSNEWKEVELPLSSLQQDSALLLPRPYPGFQPLWFRAATTEGFDLKEAEQLQVLFERKGKEKGGDQPYSVEVESIWLKE